MAWQRWFRPGEALTLSRHGLDVAQVVVAEIRGGRARIVIAAPPETSVRQEATPPAPEPSRVPS